MKDEYDTQTPDLLAAHVLQGRALAERQPKPFQPLRSVEDWQSSGQRPPKGANPLRVPGFMGGHYVPASFVAKDWGVTPRRIRALLIDGRLLGRRLHNGYWEVRFPYSFTFGTRGPSLKRQQRPAKRPKKPELKVVQNGN